MADLRLWPGSVLEDGPPPYLSHQRCLIVDEGGRLQVWVETQPEPSKILDDVYAERQLAEPPPPGVRRDDRHRYLLSDGRLLLVGRGGGCACGRMKRWEPPA